MMYQRHEYKTIIFAIHGDSNFLNDQLVFRHKCCFLLLVDYKDPDPNQPNLTVIRHVQYDIIHKTVYVLLYYCYTYGIYVVSINK